MFDGLPRIIGIVGRARVGKDVVATSFARYGYKRIALADAVKDSALAINPIIFCSDDRNIRLSDVVDALGWDRAKEINEVRRLLQTIGTEFVRDILGEDIWIQALEKRAAGIDKVVVPDIRFPNEAAWVKRAGGVLIKVIKPDIVRMDHASERFVDMIDGEFIIENVGTIDDIDDMIDHIVIELLKGVKP